MTVINREDFFLVMDILHWPNIHIFEAGSLWVTLNLSKPQIDVLKNNNILCRSVH